MEETANVVMLGERNSGKTSAAERLLGDEFNPEYEPTKEMEISFLEMSEKIVSICEAAVDELFEDQDERNLTDLGQRLFQDATHVMIFYDASDPRSYTEATSTWLWVQEFHFANTPTMLIGTKSDMIDTSLPSVRRAEEKARAFAANHNWAFGQCSVRYNQYEIEELFTELLEHPRPTARGA